MKISEIKEQISKGKFDERFNYIYVDKTMIPYQKERYRKALDAFKTIFPGEDDVEIVSAPGRSEVCGNHTDHQGGRVLAAAVNLDAIAVVAATQDSMISVLSEGRELICFDCNHLERNPAEQGTTNALMKGVLCGLRDRGYAIGGFKAYVTSDVFVGAGLSSSAAFEILIGSIISLLYHQMTIPNDILAFVGQLAENKYFGKPCGLMDQMACSVGGMIAIDFNNQEHPAISPVKTEFEQSGLSLVITNTKGTHENLTSDYAAIPAEMNQVAEALSAKHLSEIEESLFYEKLPELKTKVSGRALLRAMHFYGEQQRVIKAKEALEQNDFSRFLQAVKESGASSWQYLQNIYSPMEMLKQNMTVALGISEHFLKTKGACRVHGGGFAGTILAFVDNSMVAGYQKEMDAFFGTGSCVPLKLRPCGSIRVLTPSIDFPTKDDIIKGI